LRRLLPIALVAAVTILALAGCKSNDALNRPLTAQEQRGQRIFRGVCMGCHRADSNVPLAGPGLKAVLRKPYLPSGAPANDERVRDILIHGRRNMPAYGGLMSPQQMDDVIAYLHTL
jgi:mono/diheme cytochrome c family protein